MGIAAVTNFVSSLLVTSIYSPMVSAISEAGVFWFYATFCLICAIYVWLFIPETNNVTIDKINNFYNSNNVLAISFT